MVSPPPPQLEFKVSAVKSSPLFFGNHNIRWCRSQLGNKLGPVRGENGGAGEGLITDDIECSLLCRNHVYKEYRHGVLPETLHEFCSVPDDFPGSIGLCRLCGNSLLQVDDHEGGPGCIDNKFRQSVHDYRKRRLVFIRSDCG